jgi:hypothetical protein
MKQLQKLLEDQFLNKRISVPIPERDNKGKVIPNKFQQCAGICQFIGPNPLLGWDLQVTVDGTPIQIRHINDIKIQEPTTRIKK